MTSETFLRCTEDRDRQVFIRALCATAGAADGASGDEPSALVVLGVRADLYDRCVADPELLSALQDGQVVLRLRAWPRLRNWIDADRAGLYVHQQLTAAAQSWDREGRPASSKRPTAASGNASPASSSCSCSVWLAARSRSTRATPRHPNLARAHVLAGHTDAVTSVAFSPDGRTLATGGQTVLLWNVTDPAHPTALGQSLTGYTSTVYSVMFSSDGHTLVTGSADQTVRLWNLP